MCRCPTKVDPGRTADMVDTIQEVVAWTDFEKRDFIKVRDFIVIIIGTFIETLNIYTVHCTVTKKVHLNS